MKTTGRGAARATSGKKADTRTAATTAPAKAAIRRRQAATSPEGAPDSLEGRVTAFAEQVGRLVGTVAGKADGWMDSRAVQQQLAAVRDGAAGLLRQIAGREATATPAGKPGARKAAAAAQPAMATDAGVRRRSGGKVDAPGKKHRGPLPSGAGATTVASQAAKMREARPMAKTSRLRGRG